MITKLKERRSFYEFSTSFLRLRNEVYSYLNQRNIYFKTNRTSQTVGYFGTCTGNYYKFTFYCTPSEYKAFQNFISFMTIHE